MNHKLDGVILLSEGIFKLFHPWIEVVIHDLSKNKIVSIVGTQGLRKVGDPSYLSKADRTLPPGVFGPYSKHNSDGKAMKSVSVVFSTEKNERFMMCINFDISEFQPIQTIIGTLISFPGIKPLQEVFDENWQDKIHQFINKILTEKGRTLNQLNRTDKKELVFTLRDQGAFNGKNAASYIAQILKVSRASIYGYLSEKR